MERQHSTTADKFSLLAVGGVEHMHSPILSCLATATPAELMGIIDLARKQTPPNYAAIGAVMGAAVVRSSAATSTEAFWAFEGVIAHGRATGQI